MRTISPKDGRKKTIENDMVGSTPTPAMNLQGKLIRTYKNGHVYLVLRYFIEALAARNNFII